MTIEVESTQVAEIFEKDINKLCGDINAVIEAHNKLVDEKSELENIIKEVREYIEKMEKLHFDYSYEKQELLEILDKVDKENKQ